MPQRGNSLRVLGAIAIAGAMLATPGLALAKTYKHHRKLYNQSTINSGNPGIPGNKAEKPMDRGNMNKSITRGSTPNPGQPQSQ
jgi:hypothetical protein